VINIVYSKSIYAVYFLLYFLILNNEQDEFSARYEQVIKNKST